MLKIIKFTLQYFYKTECDKKDNVLAEFFNGKILFL